MRPLEKLVKQSISLPASEEVSQLANMMIALRTAVKQHLPYPVPVGITIPHLIAFYEEDLRDACEYAKIDCLSFSMRYDIQYETT